MDSLTRQRKIQIAFVRAELALQEALNRPYTERDYTHADRQIYRMRCARRMWRRLMPNAPILDRVLHPAGKAYEVTLKARIVTMLRMEHKQHS